MKTLFVTHGEWVRRRTGLDLSDAEHDRLRSALEGDNAARRLAAQAEVLRLARQQAERGGSRLVGSEDAALEALEFAETTVPVAPPSEHRLPVSLTECETQLEGL